MATKKSKSPGNLILGQTREYWINAGKQFEWPIDFELECINVPEAEIEIASDNLMVTHFRNHGWHIQSAIGEVEKKKVYVAPISNGQPIFKPVNHVAPELEVKSQFQCGQMFKILSSECELKITNLEHKKVHLQYTNRPGKTPLLTSEENLLTILRRGQWVRI
jgi:hypothetical protein